MLLWYRDSRYTQNDEADHLGDPPSIGVEGHLLWWTRTSSPRTTAAPRRRRTRACSTRCPAPADGGLRVRAGRPVPVPGVRPRAIRRSTTCWPATVRPRAAVLEFTTRMAWYPGYEYRPGPRSRRPAVLPRLRRLGRPPVEGQPRSTRRGSPTRTAASCPTCSASALGGGHVTGTGNPADGLPAGDDGTPGNEADLSLGVRCDSSRASGKAARIVVRPGHPAR